MINMPHLINKVGGVKLITEAKSGLALHRAPGSAPAFGGPARPSMLPLLILLVAQMPRSTDLAIFVLIDKQTDRQTEPIALYTHGWGN